MNPARRRYSGDVTILPRIGGPSALMRMVQNPDPPTMHRYIAEGRAAAFKCLSHIKHLLAVERALNAALSRCVYVAGPGRLGSLGSYDGGAHGISLSRMPSISSALATHHSLAAAPSAAPAASALSPPLSSPPATTMTSPTTSTDAAAATGGVRMADQARSGKSGTADQAEGGEPPPGHRRTPTANGAWSAELLRKHLGDAMKDPAFVKTYHPEGEPPPHEPPRAPHANAPSSGEPSPTAADGRSSALWGHASVSSPRPTLSSPGGAREFSRAVATLDSDGLLRLLRGDALEASPATDEALRMLVSRNLIVGTRALQQSAADKEALARELLERTEALHAAQAARHAAEARTLDLERRLHQLLADVGEAASRATQPANGAGGPAVL